MKFLNITVHRPLLVLAFCLILGMVLSMIDRTDANWDLQNYHLYAPYAALHGRLGMDWFAAGFQGYLNPTQDIPYYLVKMVLFPNHPVAVAALAGLPFGFLAFVTFQIARLVLVEVYPAAFATILGLTGATVLSEVGTIFDDILTADIVLSAVWLLMIETEQRSRWLAASGFLLGCAVGLKFTAAMYVPGATFLYFWKHHKNFLRNSVIVLITALVGFLVVWGWWGWQLWQYFGNPLFPILGGVFRHGAVPASNIADGRFFPKTVLQWLFYPFYWCSTNSFTVSEEPLRDPRFALVYLALGCRGIAFLLNRKTKLSRDASGIMIFFVTTYLCWLLRFSILRYALALEAVSCIVIFAALQGLVNRRVYMPAMVALTVSVLAFTKPVGWGRIGYGKSLVVMPLPAIPQHSVVLMAGVPLGFVVPYLNSPSSNFLLLTMMQTGTQQFDATAQLLAESDNAEILTNLSNSKLAEISGKLSALGEVFDSQNCVPVISPIQKTIRICKLRALP